MIKIMTKYNIVLAHLSVVVKVQLGFQMMVEKQQNVFHVVGIK
jgi:hypothetical protein